MFQLATSGLVRLALLSAVAICLLLPAGRLHAGTVNSVTVSSNGPWTVGQQSNSSGATAQYTISVAHSRCTPIICSNSVTVTDQLPVGTWPAWSGTLSTGSGGIGGSATFSCSQAFNSGTRRYTITCTNGNANTGTINLTLPVWVDQLAAGSVSNSASAVTGSNDTPVPSALHTTTVNGVASVAWPNSCTALGGGLAANQFANNGTFGAIGSNTVGNATNVNSSSPLATGSTTMSYFAGDLADGQYRISNRVSKLPTSRDGNWFWTVGDHTSLGTNGGKGDPNQLMMVMNASNDPGVFYAETLTVAPNTMYEFSLWAIHGNNPISSYFSGGGNVPLPFNIELAVDRVGVDDDNDGTIDEADEAQVIVSSGNVGASNTPTWRQYGALFNSGTATQVRFIFRNNGPGGGGNDLAIDDMVLAQCSGLPAGNLRGTLYYDDNRNDALDVSEPGRLPANVSVELRDNNGLVAATAQTDANGEYLFQGIAIVPNATYSVRVVTGDPDIPAGAILGTPNNVSVTLAQGATATVDFGFDAIRLTLRKQWASAAINDAVTISAQSGASTLRSFNAVADAADELDLDPVSVNLTAGTTVTISEAFTTGAAQDYESQLACTGSADTDLSDGLQVNVADLHIVCTYTNTRRLADLSIVKTNNASSVVSGTQATYTIVATNNGPMTVTGAVVADAPGTGLDCPASSPVTCSSTAPAACPAGALTVADLLSGVALGALPATAGSNTVTFSFACSVQ